MSKEMTVIALGVFIILMRTFLGIPGDWQTALLIATGTALVILGFLLRGESLSRGAAPRSETKGRASYTFVESLPDRQAGPLPTPHDHKEGITSLN